MTVLSTPWIVSPAGLPWSVLAIALAITFGMSVLHSVVGFAFGLLSTPAFLLLFPPKQVVVLTVLLMLVLNVLIIRRSRHAVVLGELKELAGPALLGFPVGIVILVITSPPVLRLIVGVIVLAFASTMLFGGGRKLAQWAGTPVVAGFAGGVLTTSINFNGPPIALYLVGRRLGAEAFRATTAAWLLFAHTLAVDRVHCHAVPDHGPARDCGPPLAGLSRWLVGWAPARRPHSCGRVSAVGVGAASGHGDHHRHFVRLRPMSPP